MYMIFPIPEVGLHLSIHSPKPPLFPNGHAHWRSHKLGIEEDVDASFFSPEYWKESAIEYLQSFKCYPHLDDEDVLVLQPNFIMNNLRQVVLRRKEKMIVDVGKIMQGISRATFYQTKAKKLPLLVQKMERENSALNLYENLNIWALSEDRTIVALNSKTMIEFDHHNFMGKLLNTGFSCLANPFQRAIETISRIRPDAFTQWLPASGIEEFFEESVNTLTESKLKIVNF